MTDEDGPITIDELQARIADPDVPLDSLEGYFRTAPHPVFPFEPIAELEPGRVSLEGVRGRRMLIGFLNNAFSLRRQELYRRRIAAGFTGLRFVAEGDSWFQYPDPREDDNDLIDALDERFAIYCVSGAGDTLEGMLAGQSALMTALDELQPDGFLFSAGGNDIAGPSLIQFLRSAPEGSQAQHFLTARFDSFMREVEDRYETFFAAMLARRPGLKIFCHGYDYAIPRKGGAWMGPHFEERGIPQRRWGEIVRLMIDRFNMALTRLASRFPGDVHHVDLRQTLGGSTGWRDELHGTPPALRHAARRFSQAIDAAFETDPSGAATRGGYESRRLTFYNPRYAIPLEPFIPAGAADMPWGGASNSIKLYQSVFENEMAPGDAKGFDALRAVAVNRLLDPSADLNRTFVKLVSTLILTAAWPTLDDHDGNEPLAAWWARAYPDQPLTQEALDRRVRVFANVTQAEWAARADLFVDPQISSLIQEVDAFGEARRRTSAFLAPSRKADVYGRREERRFQRIKLYQDGVSIFGDRVADLAARPTSGSVAS